MDQVMALQYQDMVDRGMTSDQIDAAKSMGEKFSGPVISSAIALIAAAFIGFVVSAIVGAIMKQSEEEQY